MIGNASLVNIYNALRGRNRWLALAVAALAKFGARYASVSFFATRPLELAFGLAFVFLRLRKDRLV